MIYITSRSTLRLRDGAADRTNFVSSGSLLRHPKRVRTLRVKSCRFRRFLAALEKVLRRFARTRYHLVVVLRIHSDAPNVVEPEPARLWSMGHQLASLSHHRIQIVESHFRLHVENDRLGSRSIHAEGETIAMLKSVR